MDFNHFKDSYPEVYLSDQISEIFQKTPDLPNKPLEPQKPIQPVNPGSHSSNNGCFIFLFIISIIGLIWVISSDIVGVKIVLLLIALIVFSYFMIKTDSWDKKKHKEREQEYNNAMQNYPKLQADYEKKYHDYKIKLNKYESDVKSLMSYDTLRDFRLDKMVGLFESKNRIIPFYEECSKHEIKRKGVSENYFAYFLSQIGYINVLQNQKIPVGNSYYYPDLILIAWGHLYIDIEIDEPYCGSSGVPIHYYFEDRYRHKKSIDEERNKYFCNNGWIVIRFAEEQIFNETETCINFIQHFVLKTENGIAFDLQEYDNFKIYKWSKEKSYQLAINRYRNSYVPKKHLKNIKIEEFSSQNDTSTISDDEPDYLSEDLPF